VAVTGGTGFVGGATLDRLQGAGHRVRALVRRGQADRDGVEWLLGDLADDAALDRLVAGQDAVIHLAGVVNAPDRETYERVNVGGTAALIAACERAGVGRFIHISSLAAREPRLSRYGTSKARADRVVATSRLDWTVVRPPAVYGPGDMEMLELFRMARRGVIVLPPRGRMSVIHVDDLARLLVALLPGGPAVSRRMFEPDDGTEGGWSTRTFGKAVGLAVDREVSAWELPKPLLRAAAGADGLVRGRKAKLTPDRVDYFAHPDWTVSSHRRPPRDLWQPRIATRQGLKDTARWYRANQLLR
jgi:nucleoside-diphosphate-sugar epimerase